MNSFVDKTKLPNNTSLLGLFFVLYLLVFFKANAALGNISGKIIDDIADPNMPIEYCDAGGYCRIDVEFYPQDLSGGFEPYPIIVTQAQADGSYAAELPYGTYKIKPVDGYRALMMTPVEQVVSVDALQPEVTLDFLAGMPRVTGKVYGINAQYCAFPDMCAEIELYRWDDLNGQYLPYPEFVRYVNVDGTYALPVQMGIYKAVPRDPANVLTFTPAMKEGLVIDEYNGVAVADFTAEPMGVSGQIDVLGFEESGDYCTFNCFFEVEIYRKDPVTQQYETYPMTLAFVDNVGRYSLELPPGEYKAIAVDPARQFHFTPASQEFALNEFNGKEIVDFTASFSGISGQVTLNVDDPAMAPFCDQWGFCRLEVEAFAWNDSLNQYDEYPFSIATVDVNGQYHLDAPMWKYRVSISDNYASLFFTPSVVEDVVIEPETGRAQVDFVGAHAGISGQLAIDQRDAQNVSYCDQGGYCRFNVEAYQLDPATGEYAYPIMTTQVNAQGSYALELPFGNYKLVMIDSYAQFVFSPSTVTGVVLTAELGSQIVDFSAAMPRISGQIAVLNTPDFNYCTSATDCRLGVEAYAYDAVTEQYSLYPFSYSSVGIDGNYELALPLGTYRLVAIDTMDELMFTPGQIDSVELHGAAGNVANQNFIAEPKIPALIINSIDMTVIKTKRNGWQAKAVVTVIDPMGNPLPGAEVIGYWSGLVQGNTSDHTSDRQKTAGKVTFTSPATKQSGSITFTVTDIIHPAYRFDPSVNIESEDTISN